MTLNIFLSIFLVGAIFYHAIVFVFGGLLSLPWSLDGGRKLKINFKNDG